MLFSTFATPSLSAILTLGLYVLGNLTLDLRGIAAKSTSDIMKFVVTGLYCVSPNFEMLNIKSQAAAGVSVSLACQSMALVYGLLYLGLLLTVGCVIFHRQDVK